MCARHFLGLEDTGTDETARGLCSWNVWSSLGDPGAKLANKPSRQILRDVCSEENVTGWCASGHFRWDGERMPEGPAIGGCRGPQQAGTPQYSRIRRDLVWWELTSEGEHCVKWRNEKSVVWRLEEGNRQWVLSKRVAWSVYKKNHHWLLWKCVRTMCEKLKTGPGLRAEQAQAGLRWGPAPRP